MYEREIVLEITKEIAPFAPDEELGKWVVRRWNFSEKQQAMVLSSKDIVAGKRKGLRELDLVNYEIQQMLICVREKPDGVEATFERYSELDADVGEKILEACRKVNGITLQERTDFLEQSDSAGVIPG